MNRTIVSLLLALVCTLMARAADTGGQITGTVSNTATGNLLEGARVEIPALGLSALTDNTGRYVLTNVPTGAHELTVSYIGLDPAKAQVNVAGGQRAVRNFDLTTAIYQLEAFKVTGEREGGAAAITAQRNAENVKNIVAMDSYGNLPNMNAGEVAIRLPGVAGNLSDENLVDGFTIRGVGPGMNTITLDGAPLTSQGAVNRGTNINNLTGTMFDQMELIKGHTPDKGADSLGGTINLKSRSPLSLREKRRISYSASARWAPPFFEHVPLREQHRVHPLFNVQWQEVFDTFGEQRNLGIAVNLFYSENSVGGYRTIRDFQNTTAQPAYVWDYRTWDNYNNRKQKSINVKADYRLSAVTKLSFNAIVNDATENHRKQYETRAFTTQQVGTTGTAGIRPGYTDRITEVRAAPGSTIEMTMTGPGTFFNRMRRFDLGAEHELGRLSVDYNAVYTQTNINGGGGGRGGILINRITNVGWILDRTQSDLFPRFVQTEGPDFQDPANYRPTQYTNNNQEADDQIKEARANAKYNLPVKFPTAVKVGAVWRERYVAQSNDARRWNFIGTSAIPSDPTLLSFDTVKTGRRIPLWENLQHFSNREPINPSIWRENLYFHEMTNYTGNRAVTEEIAAGYLMAQGRVARTGWLAGVRTERTETDSWGWVRARVPSTAAQQTADPVGSAQRDYANNLRVRNNSYTKSFPSVHLTHDVTANLKARLSWSTSFGRPPLNQSLPNETVNETNQTVTANNATLVPQQAKNWDASLEYYFEPVGAVSVGWFHKTIRDYIVENVDMGRVASGDDNGFAGEYAGYTLLTTVNAGEATARGWEFTYQQQFTFLPGWLKGLGASANYTIIKTSGDFGTGMQLTTDEVAGFIPETMNASLSWRFKKFSARVLYHAVGSYITDYSPATPARNRYRYDYKTISAGAAYQWKPGLAFTIDVANLTNEPQQFYRGNPDQMQTTIINGSTITFGVNGRF